MRAGLHRNIDMAEKTSNDGRSLMCSQLHPPKLNREFEYTGQMEGKPVSLNLHLRDDKHGNIYLQCDYVDFYEEEEREEEVLPEGYDPDDDF